MTNKNLESSNNSEEVENNPTEESTEEVASNEVQEESTNSESAEQPVSGEVEEVQEETKENISQRVYDNFLRSSYL